MRYETVQARVERAKGENMRQLDRLSSQKDIMSISDDPVGAARSIRLRDRIMNLRQYQKNIEYSKGFIETAEKALGAMADNLVRAKELAIGMANDTYDASSRDATSREVRELIEELTQLGNTTFSGRYVFAGFRSQTPPLSLDGDYLGDDGAIFLQVSRDNFRQINLPARGLFEAGPDERAQGHFNLLMAAEVLYDGLRDNNKDAIRTAINELDFQLEKVTGFQATLGGISKSLHDTQTRLSSEETLDRSTLSRVEDADLYDSSSEFKRTEAVLQGTMLASTKLLQPSLLNFLQ
jgi:flagellar hook-associated protein 3 FlgL